ncbi:MAG: hypothetical protein J5746_13975 [Victivallales bacterium]|nr:hypothetical protein [Victivallales bacterium]
MRLFLDGSDWLAQYFIPQKEANKRTARTLKNMFMDTARSAGFVRADITPLDAMPATVPGCDRSVLLENKEIDEPYYGRNADRSRWPEEFEWAFRKEFTLPGEWRECRHISLKIHSAGYKAVAFLNNEYLGERTGMFQAWTYDVSKEILREGKNVLTLIFEPAPKASPNHLDDTPSEFAYYHFCQMSFGWDWARTLVPTGIFDHVELHGAALCWVRDCSFATSGKSVRLEAEIAALEDCTQELTCTLVPRNFTGKSLELRRNVELKAGKTNVFEWDFCFPEAELWYPNNYGEQRLYTLTLTLQGDEFRRQVGFRDLQMLRNPDSCDESYPLTFCINGTSIFARGLNWVPADMIFSRTDARLYEREVRLAKEAGFNLFRVWGGGVIEKEEFYDACDRHGILVWQEFPHACCQYPSDQRYIAEKAVEGEAVIRKLRNHVSMAMYCGGNEMLYYGEVPFHPIYLKYGELVGKLAPGMPYHICSPDQSRPGERDHGPWNYEEHEFWNSHRRLLASELGCPGWAELESIDRFIPPNEPCPYGQSWQFHFSHCKSNARQLELFKPQVSSRRQMCDMNMLVQADQLEYAMGHYRKLFPEASGCFIWQYNESWPTNAYSILDFYSRPKMAYYHISHSNKPIMVFLEDASWCIKGNYTGELYFVSDRCGVNDAKVVFQAMDITGRIICQNEFEDDYPQGTTRLGTVEFSLDSSPEYGVVIMKYYVLDEHGNIIWEQERLYGAPDFSQVWQIPKTSLECSISLEEHGNDAKTLNAIVENTGKYTAVFVRADLPGCELYGVYWEDNYRMIAPGEKYVFRAKLSDVTDIGRLSLRGWNADALV